MEILLFPFTEMESTQDYCQETGIPLTGNGSA